MAELAAEADEATNEPVAPEQQDSMDVDEDQAEIDGDQGSGEDGEDGDDDEEDDEEDEDEDEPVESLVSGREKRSTAGSRYSQLLSAQMRDDAEDEVALLFAEEGEDEEFEDPDAAEAEEDAEDDDSSSDEEDQPGAEDELAGEKQLEKEERAARRAQKRKAEQALSKAAPVRKKVKIDESANVSQDSSEVAGVPRPRAKRKSERVSWIPTEAEAPVRTSSRTLSVQNKERTMESMKESEARRVRQMEIIEKANRKRQAEKTRPKTQEERLAEAARVERHNSKSLNKWEEMEKERMERQKARLEALHNRALEGPVIRWYSGRAEYVDGKLKHVGRQLVEEVAEPTGVKSPEMKKKRASPSVSKSKVDSKADPASDVKQHQSMDNHTTGEAMMLDKHIMPQGDPKDMPLAGPSEVPVTGTERAAELDPAIANAMGSAVPDTSDQMNVDSADIAAKAPPNSKQEEGLLEGLEYHASLNDEGNATSKDLPEASISQPPDTPAEEANSTLAIREESPQSSRKSAPAGSSTDNAASSALSQHPEPKQNDTISTAEPMQQSLPFLQAPGPAEANTPSTEGLATTAQALPTAPPPQPPAPKITTHTTANYLTLLNYPPSTSSTDILRRILFAWPSASSLPNTSSSLLSSYASSSTAGTSSVSSTTPYGRGRHNKGSVHSAYSVLEPLKPVCAITGGKARYLDPVTGLGYVGVEEFRGLRRLVGGGMGGGEDEPPIDSTAAGSVTDATPTQTTDAAPHEPGRIPSTAAPIWSSLLNAYVGPAGVRGPPDPIPAPTPAGLAIDPTQPPPEPDAKLLEAVRWRAARGVSEAFVGGKVVPPLPLPVINMGGTMVGGTSAGAPAAGTNGGGSGLGSGAGSGAVVVKTEGASSAAGGNAGTAAVGAPVVAQ